RIAGAVGRSGSDVPDLADPGQISGHRQIRRFVRHDLRADGTAGDEEPGEHRGDDAGEKDQSVSAVPRGRGREGLDHQVDGVVVRRDSSPERPWCVEGNVPSASRTCPAAGRPSEVARVARPIRSANMPTTNTMNEVRKSRSVLIATFQSYSITS